LTATQAAPNVDTLWSFNLKVKRECGGFCRDATAAPATVCEEPRVNTTGHLSGKGRKALIHKPGDLP